jgi:hypothetical protein
MGGLAVADLLDVYGRTAQAIRAQHLDFLAARGVSRETLIAAGLVGIARADIANGRFDFSEDGDAAFISPCHELRDDGLADLPYAADVAEPFPYTTDLCAWRPNAPHVFGRWKGAALVLGEPELRAATDAGAPVRVFRDPLRAEFFSLGLPVVADDVGHGQELRRILTPPQQFSGEILVAGSQEIAA